MEFLVGKAHHIMFLALGGGGDVASASMLALAARRLGFKSHVASVVWERLPVDPTPGPVRLSEVVGSLGVGGHSMLATGESKALRGGKSIDFQAANASRSLGEPVGLVDLASGAVGVRRGVEELSALYGCDLVVGVDVGGDVLATGLEEELWSPLADFVGLAALHQLEGVLAVHSPGSDGELPPEYVLRRIALAAERGGCLGARGMTREDAENLERILEHVESEASRAALLAARGVYGHVELRRGSRKAFVTPLSTITFFLEAKVVAELNPLTLRLADTADVEEARRRLNLNGVYTELDLEEDACRLMAQGVEPTGELLKELRGNRFHHKPEGRKP